MDSGLIVEQPRWGAFGTRHPFAVADASEIEDAINTRLLARREHNRRLLDLFGAPVFMDTTILSMTGGKPHLGPVYAPDGHELMWSLWAPHRRALISLFRRTMPEEDELKVRIAFAEEHALKYAIVKPGWRVTLDHLKGWLGT
jgi:hypothetical protein